MTDLANLDQALRDILAKDFGITRAYAYEDVIEAMRRAYALAERKEELAKRYDVLWSEPQTFASRKMPKPEKE